MPKYNSHFRDCELELTEIRKNTKTKDEPKGYNGILKYVPTDLQDSKDVKSLCRKIKTEIGKSDISSTKEL